MDSATYDISFATTTAAGPELQPGLANNPYANLAAFGTFTLGGLMPDVLTLTGSNPYAYDPADGNLLMVVAIRDVTFVNGDYMSFFWADSGDSPLIYRAYTGSIYGGWGSENSALVTEFNATAAVPEPATFVLAGLGLLGAGLFARRRRG